MKIKGSWCCSCNRMTRFKTVEKDKKYQCRTCGNIQDKEQGKSLLVDKNEGKLCQ